MPKTEFPTEPLREYVVPQTETADYQRGWNEAVAKWYDLLRDAKDNGMDMKYVHLLMGHDLYPIGIPGRIEDERFVYETK